MKFRGVSEDKFGRSDNRRLEWAIATAVAAHRGQLRKDGEPYILHPLRVMFAAGDAAHTDHRIDVMCAAILHDVCEDCGFQLESIEVILGKDVAEAVDRLTRRKDEVYSEYIARCAQNEIARQVKIQDALDNLNGLEFLPDQEEARGLRRRYEWTLTVVR
jgi:(p)ppGpp synthase/HD superfamily hydrolase